MKTVKGIDLKMENTKEQIKPFHLSNKRVRSMPRNIQKKKARLEITLSKIEDDLAVCSECSVIDFSLDPLPICRRCKETFTCKNCCSVLHEPEL
jgi:hypothetical protein